MTTAVAEFDQMDVPDTRRPTMTRLVRVESRKMIDTLAGKWLLALTLAIAPIAAIIALFAVHPSDATFRQFFSGISGLQGILLPVIGVLLITSEWSQRTALTTFTLEPNRTRVIGAKFIASVVVSVGVIAFATAVSALAAFLAGPLRGTTGQWDMSWTQFGEISLNQIIGTIQGFAFGAIILISAAAIVAIFALPTVFGILTGLLPQTQSTVDWISLNQTSQNLGNGDMGGNAWGQFATSALLFIVLPLVLGIWRVRRAEVK